MHPFGHSSLNYHTLAGGTAPDQWAQYSNMPGGPAVQLVAGMLGDSWAQKSGLANFGFQTHQNSYDMMKMKAMHIRNQQTLRAASASDIGSYEQTITGAFKMAGVDMNDPARQAEVKKLANSAASMSGVFANAAPEVLDMLAGPRGSSAAMAQSMISAGRYQIDPITGQVGMSGQSIANQANLVHQSLFAGDNYQTMKGLKAGETGRMYDELVRRGMAPAPLTGGALTRGALSTMSQGTLESAYTAAGITPGKDLRDLTPGEISRLEGTGAVREARSDPNAISAANAKQTASKLKEMAGAVSAMKEIFGDAGHPDAPMAEIMNALEQMTGGTMGQMNGGRVEGIVRKMRNLANTTGMTMEATMGLMQQVQRTQQGVGFGNNAAAFSSDITMSAMAFRGGMYGELSSPMWGRSSIDQLTMADAQLREQARGSQYTNHLAVIARLGNATGVFQGEQGAGARELITAMTGPARNTKRVAELMNQYGLKNESAVTDWLVEQSGGKLTHGQVATMMADKFGNQEYANQYRIQDIVRNMQFDVEVKPMLEQSFSAGFADHMDRAGSKAAAGVMSQALAGMKDQGYDRGSARQRSVYVARQLMKAAETDPALAALKGKSQSEIEAMVEAGWSSASAMTQSEFNTSLADAYTLHDQGTLERGENRTIQSEIDSMIQSSVAHVGKGTLLEKAMGVLQSSAGDNEVDLKKKMAEALGGTDPEKMGPMLAALQQYQKHIDEFKGSDEYKAAQTELEAIDKELQGPNLTEQRTKELEEKRKALLNGGGGRFLRLEKQLQGNIQRIKEMGAAAGIDFSASVPAVSGSPGTNTTVNVEWPKDGFKMKDVKITMINSTEGSMGGTIETAGVAPNAAQGGPLTA